MRGKTMNNALFQDKPTAHRVLMSNQKRVVYARYDHEGNFVRHVAHRTAAEIEAERKSYLPAKIGILTWFEVFEHNWSIHT